MGNYFGKISEMDTVGKVFTCYPDSTIDECRQVIVDENIGCLVVVDREDGKVVGIFTERDYIQKVAGKDIDIKTEAVESYVTTNVICKKKEDELSLAVIKMLLGNFRHIVVVDGDEKVETIFSIRDVLAHIVDRHLE